jgi:hypothetical protein
VAKWQDDFQIDGIDLDIEEGAGGQPAAGPNMVHFIRRLKALRPGLLVTQPTYGYPQVQAGALGNTARYWPKSTSSMQAGTWVGQATALRTASV